MLFYVILCYLLPVFVKGQDPALLLPQGRIVGIKVYPKDSAFPIDIFFGIPYAMSPTGRYRLSAPERHPGWRRTFFAHRMPPRCPEAGDRENDYISEDCLFLNVWKPRRVDSKPLPVIVVLYSETWSRGAVTSLPCEELAAEGVVVVTVAYRLHFLGFFTLKSFLARGNLALLDQYFALVWIRENIAIFGGDPASITLMGHSAGADSVLSHIASQRSLGLFHRAIIMSPRYVWRAIDDKNNDLDIEMDAEKTSREMARYIGCIGTDEEIMHCLRNKPLADILRMYKNMSSAIGPVPDTFLQESEQYLPLSLATALSASRQPTAQLDLLVGAADLEAINFNYEDYQDLSRRGVSFIKEYAKKKAIPEILRTLTLENMQTDLMLTEAIQWEFFGSIDRKEDEVGYVEGLARAQSSARWGVGTALLAARLARKVSRLHVYRYSQRAGCDLHGRTTNYTGAAHGTDLVALFGDAMMIQVARRSATAEERKVSSLLRGYIMNFIKYGSPTSENEWPRYKTGEAYIKDISDQGCCGQDSANRHVTFWLQYLPLLSSILSSPEQSEQQTLNSDENRLRGGVFAMSGVTVILLLLLCACAVVLRLERRRRVMDDFDSHQ